MSYARVIAACALLAPLCAGAVTLEGRILYPGRAVPAATVYVHNLDNSALHSAGLRSNEATFHFELPAGRYWVFVRPDEPGLRELYGAHTRFSRCLRNPSPLTEACSDHALADVDLGGGARRVAVDVDDWFLDDAAAAALNDILGAEPVSADPAELGRPRFSEYRAGPAVAGGELKLALAEGTRGAQFAAELSAAAAAGATFAGSFVLARLPCGVDCEQVAIIDLADGTVVFPQTLAHVPTTLPCRAGESLAYRDDSRLLEFTRRLGEAIVTDSLLWDPQRRAFSPLAQYRRNAERFCSQGPDESAGAEPESTPEPEQEQEPEQEPEPEAQPPR